MEKLEDSNDEGVWCEYIGGGRYDGDMFRLPFDSEITSVERYVLVRSKDGTCDEERILTTYYERIGVARKCPEYGMVVLYRFTKTVLDECDDEEYWYSKEDEC